MIPGPRTRLQWIIALTALTILGLVVGSLVGALLGVIIGVAIEATMPPPDVRDGRGGAAVFGLYVGSWIGLAIGAVAGFVWAKRRMG